ncbi:MAG: glutamine synthetase beta-grasp domain-containing protein, partial [Candidatus Hodarchaeota archaeon]
MQITQIVNSVKSKLTENKIDWVLCAMTDIRGIFQSFSSPVDKFTQDDQYLETGIGFDGSSIRGFKSIEQSDMIFFPDPDAVYILPWMNGDSRSAIIIGDIREPFGSSEASDVDPRGYVAKNAVKLAKNMGYKSYFGPEIEFFVFKSMNPTKLQYDYFVSPNGGAADSWGPPRILPESPDTT